MADHSFLKRRARELRAEQTPHERVLWRYLRLRQMCGVRFLRQYVVARFILDFYAPALRLALELDGGQHHEADCLDRDAQRTRVLVARGIEVRRYTNLEVTQRCDDVLRDIEGAVMRLLAHPPAPAVRPPSSGRG